MPADLPELGPVHTIDRRLSAAEYYHACIGRHPRTLESPREIVCVVEGALANVDIPWQAALDRVVAGNPGARLRLTGLRGNARWCSDGHGPRLRIVRDCAWDGRSGVGTEFIKAAPLFPEEGRTAELIVAGEGKTAKVIFRVLHVAMDGMGAMHFLQELFRALRGETPLGTNAAFSDVDLMLARRARRWTPLDMKPAACLMGSGRGREPGHVWRRISLEAAPAHLLSRIAVAVADSARPQSSDPVIVSIPVNLRRHIPGLLSTMNFTSMMRVAVEPGDTPERFAGRLRRMLDDGADLDYRRAFDAIRLLPLPWLDLLLDSTAENYASPKFPETAVLSNLGNFERSDFCCPGFEATSLYGIPLESNAFSFIFGLGGRVEITFGMTRVLASDGRLDAFMDFLADRLATGPDGNG